MSEPALYHPIPHQMQEADLKAAWDNALLIRYAEGRNFVEHLYPGVVTVSIDWFELDGSHRELADSVLDIPALSFKTADAALAEYVDHPSMADLSGPKVHVRIFNLPDVCKLQVQNIRAEHLGRLHSMDVLVQRVSKQKAQVILGVFKCRRCGHLTEVEMVDGFYRGPMECNKDDAGCGRSSQSTGWDQLNKDSAAWSPGLIHSRNVDVQWAEAQDIPDGLRGGENAARVILVMREDLVGQLLPGDRLTVNGILKAIPEKKGSGDQSFYLSVVSVERKADEYSDIEITMEEEGFIRELSQRPNVAQILRSAVAPSLHGLLYEKEALLLQLLSAPRIELEDGTSRRGDLHVLLIGDPGTGKSHLLSYIHKLAPRAVMGAGAAVSGVGLTASARQDKSPFGDGSWVAEAGLLVRADGGIAIIDEFDKMGLEDRQAIHHPMEQQTLPFAKAGMSIEFNTRCSVLAAANPKFGRWDDRSTIPEQVDLDPPLLSRFDVILIFRDAVDPTNDASVAKHVLEGTAKTGEVSPEMLRKYIAYARRNSKPKMSAEAQELLQSWYVTARGQSAVQSTAPFSPRQLLAAQRLSMAKARMRLSSTVSVEDAMYGIELLDKCLGNTSSDGGKVDISIITTGHSLVEHDVRRQVLALVKEVQGTHGAERADILLRATQKGMDSEKVLRQLEKMLRDGTLFQPRPDCYKAME